MERPFSRLFCAIILLSSLSPAFSLAGGERIPDKKNWKVSPKEEYLSVAGPCGLTFPRDHGAHPGYRIEWWYYTGNLQGRSTERLGFQLTFFRTQISPADAKGDWPEHPSSWRTRSIFWAHAALSDLKGGRFYHTDRVARGAAGLAGAEQKEDAIRVFVANWSALLGPQLHNLKASTDHFTLDLSLEPLKPPVAHGVNGYSLKGKHPESATCYYSFTRLDASGTIGFKDKSVPVTGTTWMDHEYGSAPLENDLTGWDWFSIQLKDRSELMIYLLRQAQGGYSPASSGTFVHASGKTLHLSQRDFKVDILDRWTSPHTRAVYPSRWQVEVFPLELTLRITPNLSDQELTTQVAYWEGSVSAIGKISGKPVDGVGYVELTGYAKPFNLLE